MGKAKDIKKALEILKGFKDLEGFKRKTAEELIKARVEAEYKYFKSCEWETEEISKDLNKYYLTKEGIKHWLKEFAGIKKAIIERRVLIITGDKGSKFLVFENNKVSGIGIVTLKAVSYTHLTLPTN